MNLTNTRALAVVALLAGSLFAGGAAAASTGADVSLDDLDRTVVDPTDGLTDADVDAAVDLAWANDDVRAAFGSNAPTEVTVQALPGADHVTVTFTGAEGAAASVDVDLATESVTDVLAGNQVVTADEMRTDDLVAVGTDEGPAVDLSSSNSAATFDVWTLAAILPGVSAP